MDLGNMTNKTILKHDAFIKCGGILIGELIGGSTLYGLNTETSDIDISG